MLNYKNYYELGEESMKWNKLLLVATLITVGLFIGTGNETHAAERKDKPLSGSVTEQEIQNRYSDNAKILILPEGGFLHGEMIETSIKTGKVVASYNSETDPNAITWGEIKDKLTDQLSKNPNNPGLLAGQLRGATPPSTVRGLAYGASYSSNLFSGSGWRFAGYLFKAINSVGPLLRWESHNDNGVIGTETQAWNTLDSGYAEGTLINKNAYLYLNGTKCYYNHNPQNGTYYWVGNVD